MKALRAMCLAVPLALLWALPGSADGPAPGDESWECQSCTARHRSLQALQEFRRAQNLRDCATDAQDEAGDRECPEPTAITGPDLVPPPPAPPAAGE